MSTICNNENEKTTQKPREMSPEDECRLRNGLNVDCLIKVFQLLTEEDLISMCKVDDYFKDIINESVINSRVINVRDTSDNLKVNIFETFGKSIRKVIDSELKNIVKYCTSGKLTELHLILQSETDLELDPNIISLSMPFLSNLQKLKVRCDPLSYDDFENLDPSNRRKLQHVSFDDLMTEITLHASNLQTLHLYFTEVKGDWLKTSYMRNLSELRIYHPSNISFGDLNIFLRNHYRLTKLSFVGSESVAKISETLKNFFSLDTFEHDQSDAVMEYDQKDMTNRYMFLSSLSNLKNLTLTSYTYCGFDLYSSLEKLARLNVTYLKLIFNTEKTYFKQSDRNDIMQRQFPQCNSLQELEIESFRNFKFRMEFIVHFASQFKELQKLTLKCTTMDNINKLLELIPSIRTFSISKNSNQRLPVDMLKLVRSLRIRHNNEHKYDQNLLRLIVNEMQWRELDVYKDIDKIALRILDRS